MPPVTPNDLLALKQRQAQGQIEEAQRAALLEQAIVNAIPQLIQYLDGKVTKTEIVNHMQSIGTPDALKVVAAVNGLHETIKTHKNTDLSEVTAVLKALLSEAKQIPKTNPELKSEDYTKHFANIVAAVKGVESVVKAQKLIIKPPAVNVPAAQVNVAAPNLLPIRADLTEIVRAVKQIVIPEYKTDNKEVEKHLKKTNKLLADLLDKPTGGGFSGGGASAPSFKKADGNLSPADVILSNGKLAVPVVNPDGTNIGGTSNGLTDAQLRATPVPVSNSSLPLPTGASTEATLAAIKAKTDNLDVALSTRTKPSDAQHVIVDSGVTAGLTDTQLRASAVPVTGAKTNNNAAPGATNLGVLPSVANASAPSNTEGNQVSQSQDLSGNARTTLGTALDSTNDSITASNVTGPTADGVAATGNPLRAGGVVSSSDKSYTNGQIGSLRMATTGALYVAIRGGNNETTVSGALSDGDSNGNSSLYTVAKNELYNGSTINTWDLQRNNVTAALIAAGTTTTQSNIAITTYNLTKLRLLVNLTAGAGSLVVTITGKSTNYSYNMLTSAALSGTGTTVLSVFPGATAAAGVTVNDMIPRNVTVTATVTGSITYGIDYILGV